MTKAMEFLPQLARDVSLDFIEKDGEILFTSEEVGKQLGYANPRIAINKLFNQHRNELKHYSSVSETDTEAGKRETRVFTEEGVYILSMLARTNEAKRFRAKVALLLRKIRERQLTAALVQGRREGVEEIRSLTARQIQGMNSVLRYRGMGLNKTETAKLLGCSRETVRLIERKANAMGLEA
jgi:prophage antirepressor-like protein